MQKRYYIVASTLLLFLFIAACGDDQTPQNTENQETTENNLVQEQEDHSESTTPEENDETDDHEYMRTKMEDISLKEFELEVSYANDEEYEAKINQKENNKIKAEVEDEINNVYLQGREAFDDIFPLLEKMNLSRESEDQEVIDQIISEFNLPDDYSKFEVEITFQDGKEREVDDRKGLGHN